MTSTAAQWCSHAAVPGELVPEPATRRFAAGTQGWSTQEWQRFLGALPERLAAARLADLDRAFGLSRQGNSEILFAWLMMPVRNRHEPAVPALEAFLTGQGRRKFVRPLFASLVEQGDWGRALARRIYARARPGYHPVTAGSVDALARQGRSTGYGVRKRREREPGRGVTTPRPGSPVRVVTRPVSGGRAAPPAAR